ncbi:MAG: hypothetical protein EXR28_04975 [Betaproteobacteria bacterium]|nr:hypothetical protein [Betaproteobacteria bacterium]
MAKGQRVARRTRLNAARRPAKAAKPEKAAASVAVRRGSAVKRATGSKAESTRKRRTAKKTSSPVIPYLTVRDAISSLAFYQQAFGFKRGESVSLPDGKLIQVVMHHAGAVAVKFSPEGRCSGSMKAPVTSGAESPIVLYVPCRKVDDLTARARAAGATIATEPVDMFWGERIARIVDPDGYLWCFAARLGTFDPNKIPPAAEENRLPESESQRPQAADSQTQQAEISSVDFEL